MHRGVSGRGSMWKAAELLAWVFSFLTVAAGFFVAAGSSVAAMRTSCWEEREGGWAGGGRLRRGSGCCTKRRAHQHRASLLAQCVCLEQQACAVVRR